MAFEVLCGQCSARFTLPDDLYERKVKGRAVTVRCKKCRADIPVDGVALASGSKHEPTVDLTPTAPLSASPAATPVGGLWVVSYADDDDRELTVTQIQQALSRGEIDGETLVWNAGMDDWLPIAEVPELRDLLPTTGGFLGTGMEVRSAVREPALRRSSRPPPLPGKEEHELLGDDEIGPFRSVSPGTLRDVPLDETPTVPLVRPNDEAVPAKPSRRLPSAPPKVRPDWMAEPAAPAKPAPSARAEQEEEEPPESGTPDLRSLMTESIKPAKDTPADDGTVSEDIFAIGGGDIAAQLTGIDLANLPPPSSRSPKIQQPAPSSKRSKEERAPSGTRARSGPPSAKAKDKESTPAARATTREAAEEKKSSALPWLVVGAAALVAGGWLLFGNPAPKRTGESATLPANPARVDPETPSTTTQPPTPETASTVAQPPATDSAEPAVRTDPSAPGKPEKVSTSPKGQPGAKPETNDKPGPSDPPETPTKPDKPGATAADTAAEAPMAPEFDPAAANAALSAAAGAATGCRKEGDPPGVARVSVTFAPSGRVTTALVQGPLAGTPTGSCIAAAMKTAKVPAFSGGAKTVGKTISVQ